MSTKYAIRLRGTNCYLRNVSEKKINFTTDISKAKVFERDPERKDIIEKLNAREYQVSRNGHKTDNIRLTMDRETWQDLYTNHFNQIRDISDCRLNIHQFSLSLAKKFKAKAESYERTGEYPNFECEYYGEDFERKPIY